MHYCVLLITKELPSEEEIYEIMQPYCERDNEYDENGERITPYPLFEWDWYAIGGRYSGLLKLKVNEDDEYYRWKYYSKEDRNKRLFYSKALSDIKKFAKNDWKYREEEYYATMGYRDGFLYVDGARIDDLNNFEELQCYICIDADGNAIARSTWNGNDFIKDENFDEKLETIKRNSGGMFATIIDIHD